MEDEYIFGTNLGYLKFKNTIIFPSEAVATRTAITYEIKEKYMEINQSIEIMFVNKVALIMKISNNPNLITPQYISSKRQEIILAVMNKINNIYSHRGFHITDFNYDNEFKPL